MRRAPLRATGLTSGALHQRSNRRSMYEYISLILWLLGALFILCIFESENETGARKLMLLSLVWPLYSVYLVFLEITDVFRGD